MVLFRAYLLQLSAMTTFFAFLIPFAAIGWFIVRALRFNEENYGKNSLLYQPKTYTVSDSKYWITLDVLFSLEVLIVAKIIFYILPTLRVAESWYRLFFFVVTLLMVASGIYVLYYKYKYRVLTKNITFTFSTTPKFIELTSPTEHLKINIPNDIEKIEFHTTNNRLNYNYYKLFLHSGRIVFLDAKYLPHLVVTEYFNRIPFTVVERRFLSFEPFT